MSTRLVFAKCLPLLLLVLVHHSTEAIVEARLNLRLVNDVRVVVGGIPSDLQVGGMRSHLLKAEVESILRTTGIDVSEESGNRLEVGIAGIRARNDGFYVFSLRVRLAQPMVPLSVAKEIGSLRGNLEPLERHTVVSYTWDRGATGYFRLYSDPSQSIREALFQKVNEFVEDFRMAKQEETVSSTVEGGLFEEDAETTPTPSSSKTTDGVQLISIRNEGAAIVVYDASGNVIHKTALKPDSTDDDFEDNQSPRKCPTGNRRLSEIDFRR
jgi:hypothetical protein